MQSFTTVLTRLPTSCVRYKGEFIIMDKNAKIYVAGHRGMVGSAIVRELERQGYTNIITRQI